MKITRDGQVFDGDMMLGWVDHFDPTKRNQRGSKWRGVKEGGRFKSGFATRAAAVQWVISA